MIPQENKTQADNQVEPVEGAVSEKKVQGRTNPPPSRVSRTMQILVNLIMIIVLVVLGWLVWQRFFTGQTQAAEIDTGQLAPVQATSLPEDITQQDINLGTYTASTGSTPQDAIQRKLTGHTIIPERPADEVKTYTVKRDDTLFGIAAEFNLEPETILWGNFDTLQDNPHLLKPDQIINILPIDGTYYQWKEGDNLGAVAAFFGVDPQAIIDYPGNQIDLTMLESPSAGIEPGTWIIVPGGQRALKDWGPPAISRQNPAAARYYGDGSCGSISEGAVGTGTFVWPTTDRSISGYSYSGVHQAIDIGGQVGNAVFASDSGVVVFAGWSNYGYGYLVVIDHGNGYQTAYAHLSAVSVGCGQSVFQGSMIGALGATGNATGPHLHFELSYNGVKLNPSDNLR
jgi:LysM repeat protein